MELTGAQKRELRSKAHHLKPMVYVGVRGYTSEVAQSFDEAISRHELIKVKFTGSKDEKERVIAQLASGSGASWVGTTGHIALFYRQQEDPEKRQIFLY